MRPAAADSIRNNPAWNTRGPTKPADTVDWLSEPLSLEKCDGKAVAYRGFVNAWKKDTGATISRRIHVRGYNTEVKGPLEKRVPKLKRLAHPNILPLRTVTVAPTGLVITYGEGPDGNISLSQYLLSNPRANRLKLLLDVSRGLKYLHSLDIVHGSLNAAKVIINDTERALLMGYGLAKITSSPSLTTDATSDAVGDCRWLAPEIMNSPKREFGAPVVESKPADIFAFGMLAWEVFAGRVPFEGQGDGAVVLCILKGDRPLMPSIDPAMGLTSKVWELLKNCWDPNPKKRPTVKEVVRQLEGFVGDVDSTRESLLPAKARTVEVLLPRTLSSPRPNPVEPKSARRIFCGLV